MHSPLPHTIVVVSHTHWDREWYHPLGRMRARLVRMIDELLDAPDGLPFLLDGQAIVLDDYLDVRPERATALRAALSYRALEAGPWYVLSDMLIPGGEALVRNLLEGTRTVRDHGGTPPDVLYSPDAFGHSAAGPVLAEGFGLRVAVVWRGFGTLIWDNTTLVRWTHASGATVLMYHLAQDGYEIGASLPVDPLAATERWQSMRDAVRGTNPARVALLPNGADHHARQPHRAAAIAALSAVAAPDTVVSDSLRGFAERLVTAVKQLDATSLRVVQGELRDSAGWTWCLQGTFGTRAHQKRTNAQVERLLVREVEPWLALAWYALQYDEPALRTAWKTLLATHPHDTLCGCGVDAVALAADQRWADARVHAIGLRDDALRALTACDAADQRERESEWKSTLIVRNPVARARGGVLRMRLLDDVVPDPVGPRSWKAEKNPTPHATGPAGWSAAASMQQTSQSSAFDRVESPLHYPRNAVVRVTEALGWIDTVPGYAVRPVSLGRFDALVMPVPDAARIHATASSLTGPAWNIAASTTGVLATHTSTGVTLAPLGWLESVTDAGDTYTPSFRGESLTAQWSAPRTQHAGPLHASLSVSAELERPRDAVRSASDLSANPPPDSDMVTVAAVASLGLTAGSELIEITVRGENTAGDHRLRWVMQLPDQLHSLHRIIADAAFGAVARSHPLSIAHVWPAELRIGTAPLHRWLYLEGESYGLGIISDGLAEYEYLGDCVMITLLRATGEMSRRDIPERPGHAGWPEATPLAQSRGPFEAKFALMMLPKNRDAAIAQLEAAADDFLLPLTADTWRGVATELSSFAGLTLEGDGLSFSAAKRSEDGQWLVLRCVNQRSASVDGVWHLPRAVAEARLSQLDETPGDPIPFDRTQIRFTALPFAVVTLLVR